MKICFKNAISKGLLFLRSSSTLLLLMYASIVSVTVTYYTPRLPVHAFIVSVCHLINATVANVCVHYFNFCHLIYATFANVCFRYINLSLHTHHCCQCMRPLLQFVTQYTPLLPVYASIVSICHLIHATVASVCVHIFQFPSLNTRHWCQCMFKYILWICVT
jgi:hypothetical protein